MWMGERPRPRGRIGRERVAVTRSKSGGRVRSCALNTGDLIILKIVNRTSSSKTTSLFGRRGISIEYE